MCRNQTSTRGERGAARRTERGMMIPMKTDRPVTAGRRELTADSALKRSRSSEITFRSNCFAPNISNIN